MIFKKSVSVKIVFLITAISFQVYCGGNNGADKDNLLIGVLLASNTISQPLQSAQNLPQPANNTATFIVNGVSSTLGSVENCNTTEVGFQLSGTQVVPRFSVTTIDFSIKGQVTLVSGGGNFTLDIDTATGENYQPTSTCSATILESSANVYDIQSKDCAVKDTIQASARPNATISFRARCTK